MLYYEDPRCQLSRRQESRMLGLRSTQSRLYLRAVLCNVLWACTCAQVQYWLASLQANQVRTFTGESYFVAWSLRVDITVVILLRGENHRYHLYLVLSQRQL
jgi:hypothetical protein